MHNAYTPAPEEPVVSTTTVSNIRNFKAAWLREHRRHATVVADLIETLIQGHTVTRVQGDNQTVAEPVWSLIEEARPNLPKVFITQDIGKALGRRFSYGEAVVIGRALGSSPEVKTHPKCKHGLRFEFKR